MRTLRRSRDEYPAHWGPKARSLSDISNSKSQTQIITTKMCSLPLSLAALGYKVLSSGQVYNPTWRSYTKGYIHIENISPWSLGHWSRISPSVKAWISVFMSVLNRRTMIIISVGINGCLHWNILWSECSRGNVCTAVAWSTNAPCGDPPMHTWWITSNHIMSASSIGQWHPESLSLSLALKWSLASVEILNVALVNVSIETFRQFTVTNYAPMEMGLKGILDKLSLVVLAVIPGQGGLPARVSYSSQYVL